MCLNCHAGSKQRLGHNDSMAHSVLYSVDDMQGYVGDIEPKMRVLQSAIYNLLH